MARTTHDKPKASAEAQRKAKHKPEPQENNVIHADDDVSEDFEHLTDIPEMQDFIENMNLEVGPNPTSKMVPTDTNTLNTTGLVLEVTIAIKISSDDNSQTIFLNKVLKDTGCTKTIIKRNSLPDCRNNQRKALGLPTRENS
jgi:hypothetical protein